MSSLAREGFRRLISVSDHSDFLFIQNAST